MVKLLIVYYFMEQILSIEIDHENWVKDAPDTILKVFMQKPDDTWISIEGWNAYVVIEDDGIPYIGGVHNTVIFNNEGNSRDAPIEELIEKNREVKFGIAVSDEVWEQVKQMEFV